MIDIERAVRTTHEAVMDMQMALLGLYEERAKYGERGYRCMGEGPVEMIFRLRKEIDDMIGLTDYVARFGVPPTSEELDRQAAEAAATAPAPANGAHQPAGGPAPVA